MIETRRDRRIAARQAQILDAAAHVFSQKGYQNATTKEIAEVADVSEGTLYNYFANKRDLLIGVARAYADEIMADMAIIQPEGYEDYLAQFMANRFRRGRERRLFMVFLYESRWNEDVRRYYVEEAMHHIIAQTEQNIRDLIAQGTLRDVDPTIAARTMSATIMGFAALFELGITVNHSSPELLGTQVTDILWNGLRNQEENGRES
ncbi:MAG: TetR/AcrR family transcriptional regulator [Anaerolineae bacterium]|nr:TetR/AcrR family transcriptional regulator [Anaerolineae bacterium]